MNTFAPSPIDAAPVVSPPSPSAERERERERERRKGKGVKDAIHSSND
jgi:hypothetical protein